MDSDQMMKTVRGYADGFAVVAAVYFLSPPSDRLKNCLIVGAVHGALHGWAAMEYVKM